MIQELPRGWQNKEAFPLTSTARWIKPDAVAEGLKYQEGQIFLGGSQKAFIGVRDDRHVTTIAGSRAGKGTSVLIPNLLLYPGSMVVIDPKGELATITAARRGQGSSQCNGLGQHVHVLDPFSVTQNSAPLFKATFNPLDAVDPNDPGAIDEADLIAESLVYSEENDRDQHWTMAARNLIKGLILYVACTRDQPQARNLITVRQILNSRKLEEVIKYMEKESGKGFIGDAMAQEATPVLDMGPNERGSVLSTARTQTKFLSSPAMQSVLTTSSFSFATFKATQSTVYFCLPAMRMGTHNRWLRLMINMALSSMERSIRRPVGGDVIFLMDEFPVLGKMESIQAAIGQIAGFGVKLWTVIQDLNQLKTHYPASWETFLGNAGVINCFGNTDQTTTKYVSEMLGSIDLETASVSDQSISQQLHGQSGVTTSRKSIPLLHPDEVSRYFARRHQNQIVLLAGRLPMQIDRIQYYESQPFEGLFEPDPNRS